MRRLLLVVAIISGLAGWTWYTDYERRYIENRPSVPADSMHGWLVFMPAVRAKGYGSPQALNMKTRELRTLPPSATLIADDGRWVFAWHRDEMRVWSNSGSQAITLEHRTRQTSIRLQDGSVLASGMVYPTDDTLLRASVPRFAIAQTWGEEAKNYIVPELDRVVDWCVGDDGKTLFIEADRKIERVNLKDGETLHVADGRAPAISRDGRLAYITADKRNIVVQAKGGGQGRTYHPPLAPRAFVEDIVWSPNGDALAFFFARGFAGL
jgi:hypothetical protein